MTAQQLDMRLTTLEKVSESTFVCVVSGGAFVTLLGSTNGKHIRDRQCRLEARGALFGYDTQITSQEPGNQAQTAAQRL